MNATMTARFPALADAPADYVPNANDAWYARNRASTYRAALVGECPLTTREQGFDLDDEELLDAAMAEAVIAGLELERSDIRITTWTE